MTVTFGVRFLIKTPTKCKLLQLCTESFISTSQIHHRKPRSLGRAPSKEGIDFEKPKPTARDMERGELAYKSYNELLQSIAAAFQDELLSKSENIQLETNAFDEKAHHAKCMEYNSMYNEDIRKRRETQLRKQLQQREIIILQKEREFEKDLQIKLKKYEEEVAEAISEYSNWVTLENIEDKIDEAMENIVNYNFSVNKAGRIETRTMIP